MPLPRRPIPTPLFSMRPRGTLTSTFAPVALADINPTALHDDRYVAERWMNGVLVKFLPMDGVQVRPVILDCAAEEDLDVPTPYLGDDVEFDAFSFVDFTTCTAQEYVDAEADFQTTTRILANTSFELASELMMGAVRGYDPGTPNVNPSLSSAAVEIEPGPVSPSEALLRIERQLGTDLRNAQGVIHVEPGMLDRFAEIGEAQLEDGIWYTPTGHIIVADAGYIGAVPAFDTGELSHDQTWVFTSGIPRWFVSDPRRRSERVEEDMNFTRDERAPIWERHGIVIFDPSVVGAILVDLSV